MQKPLKIIAWFSENAYILHSADQEVPVRFVEQLREHCYYCVSIGLLHLSV